MSEEFAKLMIEELNARLATLPDTAVDARLALIEYRDAIKSVMSIMGHTLGDVDAD